MRATTDATAATTDADISRFGIFCHNNLILIDSVADMDIASESADVQTAT